MYYYCIGGIINVVFPVGSLVFGSIYYFAFDIPAEWIKNKSFASFQLVSPDFTASSYTPLFEEFRYVCVSYNGTDNSNCGTETSPCRTITYAFANKVLKSNPCVCLLNNKTDSASGDWSFSVSGQLNPLTVEGKVSVGNLSEYVACGYVCVDI
jgi:hypothetical protein